MITLLNVKANDKMPRAAGEALTQGQWCSEVGYNADGEVEVEFVDSIALASQSRKKLGLVVQYPADKEGDEATYDDIAISSMLVFVVAEGLEVEDDALVANSTTTTWTGLSYGDPLVINTSGYLTSSVAGDAPAGALKVAEFMRGIDGIVFYRTYDDGNIA